MTQEVAALLIGQSPRPDLVDPLRLALPDWEIVEIGALDGCTPTDLPTTRGATYPLTTRMRNGSLVAVEESFLLPRLQDALSQIDELRTGKQKVAATILLCAGTFAGLQSSRPLFHPFRLACATLRTLHFQRIAILSPFAEQSEPTHQRWQGAGFWATTRVAALDDESQLQTAIDELLVQQPQALILDYVGHPAEQVAALQKRLPLPVFDLGQLAISALAATLAR